jgi:hypothetical protein
MLTPRTGLKSPLETRRSEEQAGRGIAWERGTSQSRLPPTRLSAAQGFRAFEVAVLLPFLAVQEREFPAGIPRQNQRAEGTKKMISA